MLITQSLMQTPVIFAFIVALFIKTQAINVTYLAESLRLIGAGLCIGLGSIGPTIGLSRFSYQACQSLGINRYAYKSIFSFTLISEAIIESPAIFSLVISLVLLTTRVYEPTFTANGVILLAAGLCMGLGTLGVGINSGKMAAQACKSLAFSPENYSTIMRTSLIGQVLIETGAMYAFLVALLLVILR